MQREGAHRYDVGVRFNWLARGRDIDHPELAAAYACGVTSNHPFCDGKDFLSLGFSREPQADASRTSGPDQPVPSDPPHHMASDYIRGLRAQIGSQLLTLPSVTVLLFDPSDRLLVMRHREGGTWLAPGGMVEPNERPADAALRELWEETGWQAELEGLVGVYGGPDFAVRYANGDEVTYVMSVFAAQAVRRHETVVSDEALEQRFVAPAELALLPLSRWAQIVLPQAWDARRAPMFEAPTWTLPEEVRFTD